MGQEEKNVLLFTENSAGEIETREITEEELGRIFFNDGNCRWDQVHLVLPEPAWEKVYEGTHLVYEGFTVDHKAFGAGRSFYEDEALYMEGIFGIKGFLSGKVYYPNGFVRFDGCFRINHAYGMNFPDYGSWYREDGKLLYHGKFSVSRSSLGWPTVRVPEGFGRVPECRMNGHLFMGQDAQKYMKKQGGTIVVTGHGLENSGKV